MADEPKTPDTDDVLELTEEVDPSTASAEPGEGDDEEEVLVFGDETEPRSDDTNLVKLLREEIKKRDKRIAETERAVRPQPVEVGKKPDLWDDCEGDPDKFESALDAWKERKATAERQQNQAKDSEERERERWEGELKRYEDGKSKLGFADVGDAEETVKASLDAMQQAVIIAAADDPAKVIYALGRHPDRLANIAAMDNPLKLAAAIARLEGQLKMVKRRKAPDPDTPERGSARVSHVSADKRLKQLEDEADRTGDRSKLVAYRRSLKEKPA